MPALAKILIVFVSMLAVARLRLPLGAALVLGGIALEVWAGAPPGAILPALGRALAGAELWLLLAVTALIIEIGRFMTEERNAREILAATRRWGGRHGPACALMAPPAVIGLVPMPAGALFSAPFVAEAGAEARGTPEWKSAVNYWFRHIWEYWWPLYPGVIVAMSVFEMDAWQFISAEILYTPVAVAAGYAFLIRPRLGRLSAGTGSEGGSNRRAFFLLLPVGLVVAAVFACPLPLAALFPGLGLQVRKLLAVLIGLLLALTVVGVDEMRGGRWRMFSTLVKGKSLSVLFTLGGVLVFWSLLEDSGLLPVAGSELLRTGIPVAFAVAALPFVGGLVTGLAVGFTGTSFPLVVGLMHAEGSGLTPLATLVLAFGFGYMGMMLSPVHLCLLVTKEYFSSGVAPIYRVIAPCVGCILAFCVLAHLVLRWLGW